jgi:hypothetical protein
MPRQLQAHLGADPLLSAARLGHPLEPLGHNGYSDRAMKSDGLAGIVTLSALSLLASCQRQRAESCPLSDVQYARRIAASRDWEALYALYRANAPLCPTAVARTGYSPKLVTLFTQHWQDLPAFAESARRDPALASFVLAHIDASADSAGLKQLLLNARTRCPLEAGSICEQLAWRAQAALIAQGLAT